jgi:hypothetical protein
MSDVFVGPLLIIRKCMVQAAKFLSIIFKFSTPFILTISRSFLFQLNVHNILNTYIFIYKTYVDHQPTYMYFGVTKQKYVGGILLQYMYRASFFIITNKCTINIIIYIYITAVFCVIYSLTCFDIFMSSSGNLHARSS